jgi:NAD(P)H-hydrate epimerase
MNPVSSHPILTCTEAKAWETGLLKDEASEWAAMQRAGGAVADAITRDFREIGGLPATARLLVLAGKGHNSGDALLAAQFILEKYPQATAGVLLCFGEAALRPLARRALDELRNIAGQRVNVAETHPGAARHPSLEGIFAESDSGSPLERGAREGGVCWDLCLDGIFGFQFHPPMDAATAQLLTEVNAHPAIRFRATVDLPSGVGDTSAPIVFRADFTYATGIVKSPVIDPVNAAAVGRLRYLDLGFFDAVAGRGEPGSSFAKASDDRPGSPTPATDWILLPSILAPLAQLRPSLSDKRTYGHLFVIGGSHSYPGAVVLAVRAALRSGVGLVTAFVPAQLVPEYAAVHPEVMWVGRPESSAEALALVRERLTRATGFLIGPGLGTEPDSITFVTQLVSAVAVPVVLDADALRLEVIAAMGHKPFIATPHAGEYQRIAPALAGAPQGMIVQKGPLTRVTAGMMTYYSPFGGPVLARGGSGDMLAGLVGGLLSQNPGDPLLAACRGVVWHGRAADLLARTHGQVSVETSQLLEQLGPALASTP